MRRLLCVFCILCLVLAAALPAGAEAICAEGCILEEGHTGACVTVPSIDATDAAGLNALLNSSDALIPYLKDKYPRLNTDGTITLQLPAASYNDTILCNVPSVTLKGAADSDTTTTMKSIRIGASGITLEGICFAGGDVGIDAGSFSGCAVSACTFKNTKYDILLQQNADGTLPTISLTNTTFSGSRTVRLLDKDGNRVGDWIVTGKADTAKINFNASAAKIDNTLTIQFSGDKTDLTEKGWRFRFAVPCSFTDFYTVYEKAQIVSERSADKEDIIFTASHSGTYTIVNDKAPATVKKDDTTLTVTISQNQSKYLEKVTVPCGFQAAEVTNSAGTKVYSSLDSNGYLTFATASAGTYTIKQVSTEVTKEVTNSTTTTKTVTKYYTINTNEVYPIYHANFMKALKKASAEEGVKLNCTEAGKRPISIPVESMVAAAEQGMSVTLDAKTYVLQLDAAALKSLAQQAKGDRVQLKYQSLNHKTLSEGATAALNAHLLLHPKHCADLAFLVSATSGGETIVDLQRGTVRLTIPFIVLPGTEDGSNIVYPLQLGITTARYTQVEDGYLTTTLTDLSEHMVFFDESGEIPVFETTEDSAEVPETTEETTGETTEPTGEATEAVTESAESVTEAATESATEPAGTDEPAESDGFPLWLSIIIGLVAVHAVVIAAVVAMTLWKRRKS